MLILRFFATEPHEVGLANFIKIQITKEEKE